MGRAPNYILFKGTKRLTLKEDDMIAEKIARIFQVYAPSLYITDDDNVAIFPGTSGAFQLFRPAPSWALRSPRGRHRSPRGRTGTTIRDPVPVPEK
ncbi:unnamed protein product [Knipowitschia caucasica]